MDIPIEGRVWQVPNSPREMSEWTALGEYLLRTFERFIGQSIEMEERIEDCIVDDEVLSCRIRSAAPTGGALALSWRAILGYELYEGAPDIRVTLFLFSEGKRVGVSREAGSFLQFVFERRVDENNWRSLGWHLDDDGEYESIQ